MKPKSLMEVTIFNLPQQLQSYQELFIVVILTMQVICLQLVVVMVLFAALTFLVIWIEFS